MPARRFGPSLCRGHIGRRPDWNYTKTVNSKPTVGVEADSMEAEQRQVPSDWRGAAYLS